ncbi:MAG: penicillin-binding protein 2 [Chloroflexi bacterium]|nr:penicillin-binding protein 2 [Chloroflexota bacterium]
MFLARRQRWQVKRKKQDEGHALRRRLVLLRLLTVLAFVVLAGQLWRLQIVEGSRYQQKAEANRLRLLPLPPQRGVIYDRNHTILARNAPSFTAAVVPADLPEDQQPAVVARLEAILGMPGETITRLIDERRTQRLLFAPVPIKTDLPREQAFILEEHHTELPGVSVLAEPIRAYPEGDEVAHVLGFLGRISAEEYATLKDQGYTINDTLGKMGVEYTYEGLLRGTPGVEQVEVDVNGRRVQALSTRPTTPGANLVLSIDLDLQRAATQILRQGMGISKFAAAVVMDVRTGEVLALVSLPTYDNTMFGSPARAAEVQALLTDPARPMLNYAVSGRYPPGSIFKLITGTAALQEGVATPATRIFSPGVIYVSGWPFYDWAALGSLDFQRAITMSSNVYFYYLAGGYGNFVGLGPDRLARYAREYGLEEVTGIDLPGEVGGIVPDSQWKLATTGEAWLQGDSYNFGIGQGFLAVTPLQMARAAAAIANGGEVLVPRVVREAVDHQGNVVLPLERRVVRRVNVSAEHLRTIREAMRQAAASGTGTLAQVPGVTVAGKTGTAEFSKLAGSREHLTHGWFLGFAPFDNPEVAIVTFVERGRGAQDAAPIAGKILRSYFEQVRPR